MNPNQTIYWAALWALTRFLLEGFVWGTTSYVVFLALRRRDAGWPLGLLGGSLFFVLFEELVSGAVMRRAGVAMRSSMVQFGAVKQAWSVDWQGILFDVVSISLGFLLGRWLIRRRLRPRESSIGDNSGPTTGRTTLLVALAVPSLVILAALARVLWLHAVGGSYMKFGDSTLVLSALLGGLVAPGTILAATSSPVRSKVLALTLLAPLVTMLAATMGSVQVLDSDQIVSAQIARGAPWNSLRNGLGGAAFFLALVALPSFCGALLSRRTRHHFSATTVIFLAAFFALMIALVVDVHITF